MKQHVTVEQICDSTYTFDRISEIYTSRVNPIGGYIAKDVSEWLTIGQMIELLNPYGSIPVLVIHCTKHGYSIFRQDRDLSQGKEIYEADELCDALWNAVKEVL